FDRAGIAQPGKRYMRHEFARIGGNAEPVADAVDFALQRREIGRSGRTGPDRMRLLLAESADARKSQHEGGTVNPVERIGDIVGDMPLDVADETQGHVIVFDVDPTGTRQASPQ